MHNRSGPGIGRWLLIWGTDVAPGDLLRLDGRECRVITRNYPDTTSPVFTTRLDCGVNQTIGKLSRVEVWDSDGTVAARVQIIIDWRSW